LKNDKTIIAYHFGQYYGLLQKDWRLLRKIEIGWLIKVLRNGCFHNGPVICPRFGALKSDSTHHFFRNACTKSGSLRFSQFSGCWLILSVYIIMSFDFPFVRLFGVKQNGRRAVHTLKVSSCIFCKIHC
jgi:hypothetical protein